MTVHSTMNLDAGFLFQGENLIGVCENGTVKCESFIPDSLLYKPAHECIISCIEEKSESEEQS